MIDKVKRQVECLVDDLLSRASQSVSILVVYDANKSEAHIYLNGRKIATISEQVTFFNWPLPSEEITRLYKACVEPIAEEV